MTILDGKEVRQGTGGRKCREFPAEDNLFLGDGAAGNIVNDGDNDAAHAVDRLSRFNLQGHFGQRCQADVEVLYRSVIPGEMQSITAGI